MKKAVLRGLMLLGLTSLVACGGGGDGSISPSGNSTIGAPTSIIGKTAVLTVERNDGSENVIKVGKTIRYSFVDANTILGEGLVTIPTQSWSYVLNGNVAKIDMEMSVGWSKDSWTFTSPTGGTYHSDTGLITGTKGWHEGSFTISNYTGGDGSPSGGGSTTGQIAVWSSRSTTKTGSTSVSIDNAYAGGLTTYYTSTPTCGDSGTITKTLSVGTHSLSAVDGSLSWGPSNFTITPGGCLTFELN